MQGYTKWCDKCKAEKGLHNDCDEKIVAKTLEGWNPEGSQTIDDMVEEFEDTEYMTGKKPNQNSEWLRTKLQQAIAQRDKEMVEEVATKFRDLFKGKSNDFEKVNDAVVEFGKYLRDYLSTS